MSESPSPRRSGEKVPKADEGRSVESKAGPLTPASRTLSPLRRERDLVGESAIEKHRRPAPFPSS